jgi:FlaA1/EpsC-like NDP-sugar epimerase
VLGTHTVARAARDHGVAEFVLISSDKAVRPTSMMGATKRLCEKLILEMSGNQTKFMAVRFGNVLGSNGSVVPLFRQQIASGGPVTVTHPDMKRYFMTIPEASQLVLQAAAMGRGGEILVLDMGEQVKIVDIAKKLILLSGFTPDVEIKIEFIGVRPGEKLYEELSLDVETTVPTDHHKIKIFAEGNVSAGGMAEQVERLRRLCEEGRVADLVRAIRILVPEYRPSDVVLSLAEARGFLPAAAGPEHESVALSGAARD